MAAVDKMVNETIGGGKFVFIGIFLFSCLGLGMLFPYNAIISATDWFEYALPNSTDIAGSFANADFIAQLVRDLLPPLIIFMSCSSLHVLCVVLSNIILDGSIDTIDHNVLNPCLRSTQRSRRSHSFER